LELITIGCSAGSAQHPWGRRGISFRRGLRLNMILPSTEVVGRDESQNQTTVTYFTKMRGAGAGWAKKPKKGQTMPP